VLPGMGAKSISGNNSAQSTSKQEHVHKACKDSMDVIQAHNKK